MKVKEKLWAMEARLAEHNGELDEKEKEGDLGEIQPEATDSIGTKTPTHPPTVEHTEESEPHSEANTPHLSSPLSEDLEKGQSSSSYSEPVENLRVEDVQNNPNPEQNKASPNYTNANTDTGTSPDVKVAANRSIRSIFPAIAHSVTSVAKNVSFARLSFSTRSSSIYGSKPRWSVTSQQMKLIEVILRFGGVVLSLITFSVMAATSEAQHGAGSTFKMKFTDYQAYNYLVALNVISFVYSCWQLFLLGQSSRSGIFSTDYNTGLFIYVCDQVLAFLLFSASTAAATAAQLSRHGLHNIWPPACSTWHLGLFCSKADAAVVMSFFCSFFVISSSLFSGYHFSKLLPE